MKNLNAFIVIVLLSAFVKFSSSQSCLTITGQRGQCKPLVKCVRFIREIPLLEKQPCLLVLSGVRGVCCPHITIGKVRVHALHGPIVFQIPQRVKPLNPYSIPIPPDQVTRVVNNALTVGLKVVKERIQLEKRLFSSGIRLSFQSPAKRHRLNQRGTPIAGRIGKNAVGIEFASKHIADQYHLTRDQQRFGLPRLDVNGSSLRNEICNSGDVRPRICSTAEKYRRIDGSCNNLNNPNWGKAHAPLERLLPSAYEDGLSVPKGVNSDLPSPRMVSDVLIADRDQPNPRYTLLLMQWGQFLDHDMTHSPVVKGDDDEDLMCCDRGKPVSESNRHPECFHIDIPSNDAFYSRFGITCMEFVRSSPSLRGECNLGPREQVNQITAFIDGSNIYGSEKSENIRLRLGRNGRLRVTKYGKQELLPLAPNECKDEATRRYCFEAGDSRVNEQPQLTVMHTVWLREHNRVAGKLNELNPHWKDERLFQEARKIVGAQMQHITYNEWLPIILGNKYMDEEKLIPLEGDFTSESYDPSVNPSITNVFSTAAFRFGHSLVQGLMHSHDALGFNSKVLQMHEHQFQPFEIYSPNAVDNLLYGLTSQKSQDFDASFSQELTRRLFQGNDSVGMDLVALNIQRSRDHGLPSYVRYRRICGLHEIRNWRQLSSIASSPELVPRLQRIYTNIDDIDIFVGGMMEKKGTDGLVGETLKCLIGDQFKKLKSGDRFWYEEPSVFTRDQLREIRNANVARVICDNGENVEKMQPLAFKAFNLDGMNSRVPCESPAIPTINLEPWREY